MVSARIIGEGYARRDVNGWIASSTSSLIEMDRRKIIVDPGSDPTLADILELKSIWPEEIDTVFLTHFHLDHIRNIHLFPAAEIVDGNYVLKDDRMRQHNGFIPGTEIEILPTPGHTRDHSSLIIGGHEGNILIAGDLFWWEDGREPGHQRRALLPLPDDEAEDSSLLMKSRVMALRRNIVKVVPGHGKMITLE